MARRLRPFLAALALIAAALVTPAHAAVLVSYTFAGLVATDDAPYAAATVDPNAVAGGFTPATDLGSNGNWNSTQNGIDTATGNPAPSYGQKAIAASIGVDQATAFANGTYFSFTFDPSSGYEADLTTLTFDILTVGTSGGRTNFYLSSSESGFATPIGSVTTSYSSGATFQTISFGLSGAEFQNVADTVEFRVYLWWDTGTGTSSGSASRFDNVTLNGTVSAIPEPGSTLLFGVGLTALLFRGRRRQG